MKVAGIAFEETLISLDAADFKTRLLALSGAGKVPVLIDGDIRVWESLAILEYLAEKFPVAGLWPRDPAARAHARASRAEMHAGFPALRRQLPMNVRRPIIPRSLDADAAADVARIEAIWSECRSRFGKRGRFFTAHSARPTPCTRRLFGVSILMRSRSAIAARDYMSAHMALPAWSEWREAARREPGCFRTTRSIGRTCLASLSRDARLSSRNSGS